MARYLYLNRPGSIGCQPDGYTAMESGLPKRYIGEIDCFGWVEYAEALDAQDVYRYDLLPAEPVEQARYSLWRHQCDRDWDAVERWLTMCRQYRSILAEQRSIEYRWSLTILEEEERNA